MRKKTDRKVLKTCWITPEQAQRMNKIPRDYDNGMILVEGIEAIEKKGGKK